MPVYPVLDRLSDLGSGRQVQLWQDLLESVLHHIVPLLCLTQSLRVSDRFQDVLDAPFLAELVEGALASFDRIELGPVVGQELLRKSVRGNAFSEQLDGLPAIGRPHDLRADLLHSAAGCQRLGDSCTFTPIKCRRRTFISSAPTENEEKVLTAIRPRDRVVHNLCQSHYRHGSARPYCTKTITINSSY